MNIQKLHITPVRVLFICLGNICRSPMAEAIFRHLVESENMSQHFTVDAAGIKDWNTGEPPDERAITVLADNNIRCSSTARQVSQHDLEIENTLCIAMDRDNIKELKERFGADVVCHLLMEFTHSDMNIEVMDPYHTGAFDIAFVQIYKGCEDLFDYLKKTIPFTKD